MAKRLRDEPIYLAPEIHASRDDQHNSIVTDLRTGAYLDPYNVNDKIFVYKRQVEEWFLNRAVSLYRRNSNDFIVVMISTSYIEGVEQYRAGRESNGRSKQMFLAGIRRIFGLRNVSDNQLANLYRHLRCGLFHNGMSGDLVVLNRTLRNAIEFSDRGTIDINPRLFLSAIIQDFSQYINKLGDQNNIELRNNFDRMFTVV